MSTMVAQEQESELPERWSAKAAPFSSENGTRPARLAAHGAGG